MIDGAVGPEEDALSFTAIDACSPQKCVTLTPTHSSALVPTGTLTLGLILLRLYGGLREPYVTPDS